MEPQKKNVFTPLLTVTPLSKYVALGVFIILPFVGGIVGYSVGVAEYKNRMDTLPFPVYQAATAPSTASITITDSTDFYDISVVYPVDARDTDKVIENFVRDLVEETQQAWRVGGEMYQAEAAVTAEFPDRTPVRYLLDVSYSSTSNTQLDTTSYVLTISEMTGGANSNVAVATFTFGPNGQVAIEDVIDLASGTNAITLSRALATAAKEQNPSLVAATAQLEEGLGIAFLKADGVTFDPVACACDGFFFGSNFQNFSITDTGITFTFSKYAIAPGVAMTPSISLSWQELAPYLTGSYRDLKGDNTTASVDMIRYESTDGQFRLSLDTSRNTFVYTENGLESTGSFNPERGWQNDQDATVYILNWQLEEAEQIMFVRQTTDTENLRRLTNTRQITPVVPPLVRQQ